MLVSSQCHQAAIRETVGRINAAGIDEGSHIRACPPENQRGPRSLLTSQMSIGCDEEFTRFASRADDAIVIDRQSRLANRGSASINTNSSSQSSAASLACSEPNNSVTALMNAPRAHALP